MKSLSMETKLFQPMLANLTRGEREFRFFCTYVLRRDCVFKYDTYVLPSFERAAWLEWVNYNAMPRNKELADTIRKYQHLVTDAGYIIPPSWGDYLDYHDWWFEKHMNFLVGKKQADYFLHARENFPSNIHPETCRLWLDVNSTRRHDNGQRGKSRRKPKSVRSTEQGLGNPG